MSVTVKRVLLACAAIAFVYATFPRTPAPPAPARAGAAPVATVAPEKVKPLADLAKRGASPASQRAELRRFLRSSGVGSTTIAAVLRHTRDGITLWPGGKGATSHLGGTPVLPRGEPWPTSESGNPFTFIGAFDLADLPPVDPLPRAGTLALYWNFWLADERGGGKMDFVAATRAYYIEPGADADHPDPPRGSRRFASIPLRGTATAIAGDPALVADEVKGHGDRDELFAAMNALMQAGLYTHRLLGAPTEVQGPVLRGMPSYFDPRHGYLAPESRERYSPQEREHGDWVLLAQIEEDEDLVIADGGVLYFVILRDDLEARRFDRVIGLMDSH